MSLLEPVNNTVIIGLGSNINPRTNISKAKKLLKKQSRFLGQSKFVKTKPVGYKKQNDYLNGAVMVATSRNPSSFKSILRKIESQLGRKRAVNRYGPRTIDLDILVWNGKIVGPEFHTRDFIRKSVLELMPGLAKKPLKRTSASRKRKNAFKIP